MECIESRPTWMPVDDIMRYNHPRVIERHARDCEVSQQTAARRFDGLKQFLVVAAMTPGRKVTSPSIDAMWHSFLLFTKDYRQFCTEYLGRFVEHEPFENAAPWAYGHTRDRAAALFGSLDPELWPLEAKADCTSGCED